MDEFIDGQWITVDILKVIDGVQHKALGFGGPGSGTNDPPGSVPPGFDPLVLDSLAITGPVAVDEGAPATYTATATAKNSTGSTTVAVIPQWSASQFTIDSAGLFQPGYVNENTTVNITASYTLGGVTKTSTKSVTIVAAPSSHLSNISTRMRVLTDEKALIGGLIITGNVPKQVILRAIGPSLVSLGLADALTDPVLELHMPDKTVMTNDNWKDDQQAEIEATGLAPGDDKESAIVATLAPGLYTAVVSGKEGGTGVGLVEAYDLDLAADSTLGNISTRGFIDTGDNVMIGGLIIGGGDSRVLVRAIGPELTAQGVAGALEDPTLELRDSDGALITSNDDWKETQQTDIEATGLGPADDRESAILMTLAPETYTAIVRGKNDTTGVGLVEVYHLP